MTVTTDELVRLRTLINELDETKYADEILVLRIEENGNDLQKTAGLIWREKASGYAELVNVTEGSSSRSLGNLYKQALEMAASFGASDIEPVPVRSRATTRAIERA